MTEPSPSDTLTPTLTTSDKRVLEILPLIEDIREIPTRKDLLSAHQVAERLGTDDVADVRRVLAGLVHLRHAFRGESRSRRIDVYWRES